MIILSNDNKDRDQGLGGTGIWQDKHGAANSGMDRLMAGSRLL
jgi:hypothetical protein